MDQELEAFIKKHRCEKVKNMSFVEYLYLLMDKYGFQNASELYSKANISRQLWSSIISDKSKPSLNICLKILFTIHASNEEVKTMLKKAGYTLASSSKYSLIIRYAFEHQIYDLYDVNKLLIENGFQDYIIK